MIGYAVVCDCECDLEEIINAHNIQKIMEIINR